MSLNTEVPFENFTSMKIYFTMFENQAFWLHSPFDRNNIPFLYNVGMLVK